VNAFDYGPFTTVEIDGVGTYRMYTGRVGNSYVIAAGLPVSTVNDTIGQILLTVGLVTVGGLLVLAAIVALVIQRSLKPLRSVAETAGRVAAQPLDSGEVRITERVSDEQADPSDEIGAVGAALNTLLDHVDSSLAARQRNEERMRAFVADASTSCGRRSRRSAATPSCRCARSRRRVTRARGSRRLSWS
jgi:two-component system OmpR family sensor kinase